ncbi:hypothetical protein HYH03_006456 [Edaphochlamys debaryana]|uniref:Uncharacterized protein n=1 Tax=Edaphochlamys debaryana TaxID=47281 RepID=A0A835Y3Z7_9CHLO|nr:hypothetical protein HYH03_006456 [Edaphochlamys debaryana]|eukprot:KAG2495513.1 hypothetical protein HYH03_006456 [Edaphochlamys debaryana]
MADPSDDFSDEDLDLDDIPLCAAASNGRYEHDEAPMPSMPSTGFSRLGPGFKLNLPAPVVDDHGPPEDPLNMRSEPLYMPETSRGRAVPGLALGLGQGGRATSTPVGAAEEAPRGPRGPLKPPMLHLANPASASPIGSAATTPAFGRGVIRAPLGGLHFNPPAFGTAGPSSHAAALAGAGHGGTLDACIRVELISSAFVLQSSGQAQRQTAASRPPHRYEAGDDDEEGRGPAGEAHGEAPSTSAPGGVRVAERCAAQLGIDAADLSFFELRPIDVSAILESGAHVGVMIRGSTFSLTAIEDMLARSKRDAQLTTLLEGALRDASQQAADAKQQAQRVAAQNEELAVLREKLKSLESTNQQLRDQLQRSDEHRQLLGSTIRTIKKEFEDFKGRVVVEAPHPPPAPAPSAAVDALPLQQLSLAAATAALHPAPPGAGGTGASHNPGSASGGAESRGGSHGHGRREGR